MPIDVPQLAAVEPTGPVTQAPQPVPVAATIRIITEQNTRYDATVECEAVAWTAREVQIRIAAWQATVWLPAAAVQRR